LQEKAINVLIAGVGGQGVVLAGEILALAFLWAGYDVKKTETHGMAQRGGSVVSHVRAGEEVHSPLIPLGRADALLALEKLEALRWSPYLKPGGTIIINDYELKPLAAATGLAPYPQDIFDRLSRFEIKKVKASAMAEELGNPRLGNSIILGVLSVYLGLDEEAWGWAFAQKLPPKLLPSNLEAFHLGRGLSL